MLSLNFGSENENVENLRLASWIFMVIITSFVARGSVVG
jgi:hypothetical protein